MRPSLHDEVSVGKTGALNARNGDTECLGNYLWDDYKDGRSFFFSASNLRMFESTR